MSEGIEKGFLKYEIKKESFIEMNKHLINNKMLALLNSTNLSEEEKIKNYPTLTKNLHNFLNNYIQARFIKKE